MGFNITLSAGDNDFLCKPRYIALNALSRLGTEESILVELVEQLNDWEQNPKVVSREVLCHEISRAINALKTLSSTYFRSYGHQRRKKNKPDEWTKKIDTSDIHYAIKHDDGRIESTVVAFGPDECYIIQKLLIDGNQIDRVPRDLRSEDTILLTNGQEIKIGSTATPDCLTPLLRDMLKFLEKHKDCEEIVIQSG